MNDQKLPPYQRLKAIINDEPHLTDKASKNIDSLLGIESSPTLYDKIKDFFLKIDSKIFSKRSKITNVYSKRKR